VGSLELMRVALPWRRTPEEVALLVRGDDRPVALAGAWAGGGALVTSTPTRVTDTLDALADQPEVDGAVAGAVGGGWFGYLGFDLLPGPAAPPRPVSLPRAQLAYYDHVLHLDSEGRWWFEALSSPGRAGGLAHRLETLLARRPEPRPFGTRPWRAYPGLAGHELAVQACRERIAAGDLYQANLSLRLGSRLTGDPLDAWVAGRAALAPARAAYVGGPWGAVASLSPELFLERRGREVLSAPIKGTADSAGALAASVKDRAENVMIVDLVRNDLGRVCEFGTVRVDALAQPRSMAGVWNLVSEVRGRLRPDVDDAELVRATFAPGSVTGAPKLAALDVIAELESTGREAYCGAIGFASPLAGLELNVAIRTLQARGEDIWLSVGGGVVADSQPRLEAEECLLKARPLLGAIGATLAKRGPRGRGRPERAPAPRRLHPRPLRRPDPAAGLLETLAVRDGAPLAAESHLARMGASFRSLYGRPFPHGEARRRVSAVAASRAGHGRLRLTVAPDGSMTAAATPLAPPPRPLELVAVTLPGGLGPHKWADRSLIDALSAATAPGVPLFVDLDGFVLEAAWANVVAREGDALVTPPADGRILGGVGRAALAAREEPITLRRLRHADSVFVVNALRGLLPAMVS
jgi:para-aminobenzoate synthetase / 4-amino-4-deoxychorismate lyase